MNTAMLIHNCSTRDLMMFKPKIWKGCLASLFWFGFPARPFPCVDVRHREFFEFGVLERKGGLP